MFQRIQIFCFLTLLVNPLNASNISLGVSVSPNVTIPVKWHNNIFWNLHGDSATSYKNIHLKSYPRVGLSADVHLKFIATSKSEIKFTMQDGLGYSFNRYALNWQGQYSELSAIGDYNIRYTTNLHRLSLNCLPGINYSNLSLYLGVEMIFTFYGREEITFTKGSGEVLSNKMNAPSDNSPPVRMSIPVMITYSIPIKGVFNLTPFIKYSFGVFDIDGFVLGNENRQKASVFICSLNCGFSFEFDVSKKQ